MQPSARIAENSFAHDAHRRGVAALIHDDAHDQNASRVDDEQPLRERAENGGVQWRSVRSTFEFHVAAWAACACADGSNERSLELVDEWSVAWRFSSCYRRHGVGVIH